jgi:tetratricopeptide (TPR) repeat protein
MEPTASPDQSRPDQERVEQLLRDAHIQRMRGQWGAAEDLCRKALELDPDDAMGREMLGDILYQKGAWDDSLVEYRAAFAKQPQKGALEEKIARVVLRKDEDERERIAAELMLTSPTAPIEAKRSATLAILLSLALPGLGQALVYKQHVKGGILALFALLSLVLGGAQELMKLFVLFAAGSQGRASDRPNDMLAALGLLHVLIWLYSLIDAASPPGSKKKKASDV